MLRISIKMDLQPHISGINCNPAWFRTFLNKAASALQIFNFPLLCPLHGIEIQSSLQFFVRVLRLMRLCLAN